ncbi:MAG: UDP-N-acetylglucosamine 4,6-dehydratase (inverting) [Anaerohalosphaeraceae bacterium]|nr:UDP-N-acetylglucosamine 4,6-dehydratase (inverting) [Anaerohalosphaeraceae bacterium]
MLNGKTVLITGGTGSFGNRFTERILTKYDPKKVIIYSRDEYKQYVMQQKFAKYTDKLRFFLGDVRDKARLCRAFDGVDYVVHAAALKQVPALEYNPTEAVKTNISGADNIVDAAIDTGVKKVVAISTDKASNPANLYGATKLVAEKIFVAANSYAGGKVKFSVVRYGNVVGSRGSIVPLFMDLKKKGVSEYPITDERMTRFWITLDQGVDLVFKALDISQGGETFIPKIPSMKVVDLARAMEPGCKIKNIGIRPGEKLHEVLVSCDEARDTKILDDIYVIMPQFFTSSELEKQYEKCPKVKDGFVFQSDVNEQWLDEKGIMEMIKGLKID